MLTYLAEICQCISITFIVTDSASSSTVDFQWSSFAKLMTSYRNLDYFFSHSKVSAVMQLLLGEERDFNYPEG